MGIEVLFGRRLRYGGGGQMEEEEEEEAMIARWWCEENIMKNKMR